MSDIRGVHFHHWPISGKKNPYYLANIVIYSNQRYTTGIICSLTNTSIPRQLVQGFGRKPLIACTGTKRGLRLIMWCAAKTRRWDFQLWKRSRKQSHESHSLLKIGVRFYWPECQMTVVHHDVGWHEVPGANAPCQPYISLPQCTIFSYHACPPLFFVDY